jgi:hypothetical protein
VGSCGDVTPFRITHAGKPLVCFRFTGSALENAFALDFGLLLESLGSAKQLSALDGDNPPISPVAAKSRPGVSDASAQQGPIDFVTGWLLNQAQDSLDLLPELGYFLPEGGDFCLECAAVGWLPDVENGLGDFARE